MEQYLGEDIEKILGEEFLTWLWFKSETNNSFTTEDKEFTLFTERKVVVEHGEGPSAQLASSSGPASDLKEARLGVSNGKKVVRATYRMECEGEIYLVMLRATDLSFNGFRSPKIDTRDLSEDETDAYFLEKIFLLEQGIDFIDTLYSQYIHIRCSDAWYAEKESISAWILDSLN